jgi:hypothetical protein
MPGMDDNSAKKFDQHVPDDLATLPTMPYSERPVELPLDIEECRTAIWMASGNISEAASILKVTSIRLRNFVKKSAYLSAEMQEASDRLVDIAESNVKDALTDAGDPSRRDTMSRFVLSNIGKARGWGSTSSGGVSIKNSAHGTIIVQWEDGSKFGEKAEESNVIDGEMVDVTGGTDKG